MTKVSLDQLVEELLAADDFLIVQDIDGVCIPLVKDPLTRKISSGYIHAVVALKGHFMVLTNGEHEGRRGVNRLVEQALGDPFDRPIKEGLYLPGLAAGGVQLQDRFGMISHAGVSAEEIKFLASLPERMINLLDQKLATLMPNLSEEHRRAQVKLAVLDTQLSPTINLNGLFNLIPDDLNAQYLLQLMLKELMNSLLDEADNAGLKNSFFLHVAPNLGDDGQQERLKPPVSGDVGTTDIQFMLRGALKEAGLLVLINQHIANRFGDYPFGPNFNARTAPHNHDELLALAESKIKAEQMPLLVGVGDTVTSNNCELTGEWLRGGSDRKFLHLIQDLGELFGRNNRVVLVDSSGGEVDRPSLQSSQLVGVSDPDDPLSFDVIISTGPSGYVEWFCDFAKRFALQH